MSEETLTSAFTDLRRGFLRLAQHFLPSREDADDILQEAFCRLWPRAEQLRTRGEVEAMTVTTVRNLCIDELRRRERTQTVELNAERDASLADSVSDRMERQEQFRLVEAIIERELTPLQRRILRLKEYEDHTVEEIADALQMQPAAVRMHLSRARKEIRSCYQRLNVSPKTRNHETEK